MQFKRQIKPSGNSVMIIIPVDLAKYLNLNVDDNVIIADDIGKYGPFLSVWKEDQKPVEEVETEVEDKTE